MERIACSASTLKAPLKFTSSKGGLRKNIFAVAPVCVIKSGKNFDTGILKTKKERRFTPLYFIYLLFSILRIKLKKPNCFPFFPPTYFLISR
ncbi:MAG: hypothetical protein A3C35_06890 [Omnitrophica bacterium RIFCSPHIGHO2_02_FULL_46_11]|nr:MAG: hypothetical protein A3C35_06890 [Omnitrophica bacterium RIFCSPHIGHO2_02_FULL_46_11]OGW86676.1 MAG: hypothetical protein A3A81_03045 [Omnitrophica bacterium RIFCSPLOWO2_01_FULL_45_10b]